MRDLHRKPSSGVRVDGAEADAMIRREDAVKFDYCAASSSMASRCCSHFASSSEAQSVAAIVKFCKIEQ